MVKKVLTLAFGLMLTFGAIAQTLGMGNHNYNSRIHNVAPISQDSVRYWVGQGSNRVVVLITWFEEDNNDNITKYGFVWGVRFNGTVMASDIMDTLNTYESRINIIFSGSHSFINDMTYDDGTMNYEGLGYGWMYEVNGSMASAINAQSISNNNFIEWFEWDGGSGFSAPTSIDVLTYVEDPNGPATPEEATIAASDIIYWVGEGSNQVVMAVNWADTALAWGYRFNGTKTVGDMMDDIAAADPRFSYTMDGYYLGDINFNAGNRTLGITSGNYWSSINNGFMDAGMGQTLANGDFEKWADPAAGVIVDSTYDDTYHYWWYTYVYPMTIYAVNQPAGMGPFCGAAETEGSTAIAYNDSRIKAWATGCTIVRGSQNLSNPDAPVVTYGTEDEAIGAASTSTMNVVSLGDGGSATLTFDKPIANGEGYDFAVFENSFNDYFLELAFVEVSSDGQRFVRFPATSLTQTAHQIVSSVDPTYINNLAGKYRVGFGTPFDLDELRDSTGLDINNITHIRVIDVVGSIDPELGTYDAFGHIINDPFPTISYSAGFDLDGIAVINQKTERIELAENGVQMSVSPNPATDHLCITLDNLESIDATLFDINGRAIKTIALHNGANTIDISMLPNGIYMIRVAGNTSKIIKK